jgi:tRNA dimethylallyltransferase
MAGKKVILLVGPTCVGKTGVSIALAEILGTEIISADSMQVYRHMDIGTEKPTREERRRVVHHMVDVVGPGEEYSAGRYMEDVVPIIEALMGRGKVPVVTGGTGLYIKAMTRGLFKGPGADWSLREDLLNKSPALLYKDLRRLDPEAAADIMPNDKRRIVRALEVCLKSGGRISELRRSLTSPLPYEFLKVGLSRDRAELYRMIEERVEGMMERGLLEEVRAFLKMSPARTPMQAIGYKEIAACLEGAYSLGEAVRLIKRNTKRYAKRQFTWFKKEEGLLWADLTGINDAAVALSKVLPLLGGVHRPMS